MKIALGRLPESDQDLSSQPTLSRFDNAAGERELKRLNGQLLRTYLETRPNPAGRIAIDLDSTDDPTHGQQAFSFYHGFYRQHMFRFIPAHAGNTLADAARAYLDHGSSPRTRGHVQSTETRWSEYGSSPRTRGTHLLTAHESFEGSCRTFEEVAGGVVRKHIASTDRALEAVRDLADSITQRHAELREWCAWRAAREAALGCGLGPLVEAVEAGRVSPSEIAPVFEAAYCTWWSSAVIGADPILRAFNTPEHVAAIERFRALDNAFQQTTIDYVAAKLRGALPSQQDVERGSEWGTLQRELQKQRQHKPVRQLIKELPTALPQLTPCFMMSPLSIAQYLEPDQALFDVVIFDEASQITVWDAVGAIARGRQTIVVGDPRQMPPTNFFTRSEDDPEGDVETESDLESILDEMIGASVPRTILNWHYRSRRESLIAFSNHKYYENSLVTFPAPNVEDRGVRFVKINGVYARGGARHNEAEAKAIVAECVRRLTSPDEVIRNQSIGVVTFNSEQQTLIENLLDQARSNDPGLEWAFAQDDNHEPVFVKNLETVQGDERDAVLFSVTYGPDASGHVTMNFGPMNRAGGHRRLNVAITRARSEMMVFSSLDSSQIDLSRTQARAVQDLKHFLEYAERGSSALGGFAERPRQDFESPFEMAVAQALRNKGWEVHSQIGVSAYRIDLGVVHPDKPWSYLAGVECDGASYHSSATARDRDKIRQSVLEGLGWKLIRIWSSDWWTHKEKHLLHLDAQLNELLRDGGVQGQTEGSSTQPTTKKASLEPAPQGQSHEPGEIARAASFTDARQSGFGLELEEDTNMSDSALEPSVREYRFADLSGPEFKPIADRFYDNAYERNLIPMIDHVIDVEGPIHEEVLVHRIARHHGLQRAGRQINEIVLVLATKRRGRTKESVGGFFWSKGTVKDRLAPARIAGRDDELRSVERICADELLAIARHLRTTDPLQIARAIGIARLSAPARSRIERVLGVQ